MSLPAPDEVLGEAAALARKHGYATATAFADSLPADHDASVLLLASDDDAAPAGRAPAGWLAEIGDDVRHGTVTAPPDPAVLLRENRVVVSQPCDEAFGSALVETVALLRQRPPGSFLVVLTRADAIQSDDELALIERNAARLLAGPGAAADGGDLRERRVVLWADGEAPPLLAERLTTDRAAINSWLGAPVTVDRELVRLRAAYLIELAEREAGATGAAAGSAGPAVDARRLELARGAAADGRKQVAGRLTALGRSAGTQLSTALRALETTLSRDTARHLANEGGAPRRLDAYLEEGVRRWREITEPAVLAGIQRQVDDVIDAFQEVDWETINRAEPTGGPYPGTVPTAPPVRFDLPAPAVHPAFVPPQPPAQPDRDMRLMLVGGGVGAALGLLAGGFVGMAVVGVIGATGARMYGRYATDRPRDPEAFTAQARAATAARIGAMRDALPAAVDAVVAPLTAAITAEFDAAERGLADRAATPEPAATPDDDTEATLRALRRRLI